MKPLEDPTRVDGTVVGALRFDMLMATADKFGVRDDGRLDRLCPRDSLDHLPAPGSTGSVLR
jgi:hypothetical protein